MSSNGVYIIWHDRDDEDGWHRWSGIVGAAQSRVKAKKFIEQQKTDPWNKYRIEKVKYVSL